jgi:cyclic lactone autoinducer peptide
LKKIILKFCSFAIAITAIASNACRGNWYQPEEPEGFNLFCKIHRKDQE